MAFDWDSIEITATTKGYGGSSTEVFGGSKEKAARRAEEAAAWESMEITFESKQTKSAEQVLAEYNSKSNLDATVKASPIISKSLDSMSNAAMDVVNSGIGFVSEVGSSISALGDLFGGGMKEAKNQASAAISEIGKITDINGFGGMIYGNGVGGGFNPAGLASPYPDSEAAAAEYVSLAKTVFTSGSSVEGETVDVYKGTINSPQNKIKSVLSDIMDVVGGAVGGTLSGVLKDIAGKTNLITNIAENITDEKTAKGVLDRFKKDILSGVPLTKDGITKTLFESIGYDSKSLNFKDGISGLGKSMLNDITKQIDGATGLITMYEGVKVIVDGDYDTAEGVFKILENITGNSKLSSFVDMSNHFKILNTVTASLMNLGADEWFDKIIESVTEEDRTTYIKDNMSTALSSGDVDFIKTSLGYVNGGWILANNPDSVKTLLSNYVPQVGNDDQVSKEEYSKLIKALYAIDPTWDIVGTRHGVKIYDYNMFSTLNNQAKLAILANNNRDHIRSMIGCQKFAATYDTVNELQSRYPYYPIA